MDERSGCFSAEQLLLKGNIGDGDLLLNSLAGGSILIFDTEGDAACCPITNIVDPDAEIDDEI